jgi:uncharacterized phage protein (TIGR02218 family)
MPTLPTSLLATINSGEVELCRLYWIRRKDGVEYTLTDYSLPLTVTTSNSPIGLGVSTPQTRNYVPLQSPDPDALTTNIGTTPSTSKFSSYLTLTGINLADIRMGRFQDSEVLIFLMDPTKPDSAYLLSTGYLAGATDRGGEKFEVNYFSLEQRLGDNIGTTIAERCPYKLGEARCTVAAKTTTGIVQAITSSPRNRFIVQIPVGVSFSSSQNFWAFGVMEILTTASRQAGLTGEVIKSVFLGGQQHEIFLMNQLAEPLVAGDTVRLIEGCENTVTACENRNNIINYGAFPDLPGIARLLTSG